MLKLASRETSLKIRSYYLASLLIWVPFVSSVHALCFLLDGILFPKLHKINPRRPIFMVGHARSGTTYTHRLLAKDTDKFSVFKLYELFFPSLIQKILIRKIADIDKFLFRNSLEKLILFFERKGYENSAHEMRLNAPEEDDIIFFFSMASGYWITKMPYMDELDFYHVDKWPEKKRHRLMSFYRDCVKRQLYLNGPNKIHLSKNPIFSGRIKSILEVFPDARFIVNVRSPNETIPSLLKLLDMAYKKLGWGDERRINTLKILAEQSFDSYLRPIEFLDNNHDLLSTIVNYPDLILDPIKCIENIYEDLEITLPGVDLSSLLTSSNKNHEYISKHQYSLSEFGLDSGEIEDRLEPLFIRFQWDRYNPAKERG